MVKPVELNNKEQQFVERLCKSCKENGSNFSGLRMVYLTRIAIENMHTGARKKDKPANANSCQ